MGAIIRLVCFIKTKNLNTVQNFTFQSVMNIMHCFLLCFLMLSSHGTHVLLTTPSIIVIL